MKERIIVRRAMPGRGERPAREIDYGSFAGVAATERVDAHAEVPMTSTPLPRGV